MGKPIRLTPELKKAMVEDFAKSLESVKMADGEFKYSRKFTYKSEEKAQILFTPTAYAKMIGLLMNFDSEVAWHGVGERLEEKSFLISDILVYPQVVSGATVEMDPEEYAGWLFKNIEDDRFNHIIMQGHSHVNMGTTPSVVDISHQEEILKQLSGDMFYIFMIWNKRLENTTKIYDLANNTLYDKDEIVYGIVDEDESLEDFVANAKAQVKKKTYATAKSVNPITSYTPNSSKPKDEKPKTNKSSEYGSGWQGRGSGYMADEASDIYKQHIGYYDYY